MSDFYARPQLLPLDQADGLRRLFGGRQRHVLPLAANPHVASSALVLDRLASLLAGLGKQVLVVDAAGTSPLPHELADVDLSACIESLAPRVNYLAARGLPRHYVDTRGSAAGFISAVQNAAPQAEVLLLHADGIDLARLLKEQAARPMLLGADHPESIKHAYANAKLLVRRCGLMTFDLLLAAARQSPRAAGIASSLSGCVETFLGAVLRSSVRIDPAGAADAQSEEALTRLLAAQLALDEHAPPQAAAPAAAADAQAHSRPRSGALSGSGASPDSRPAFR